MSDDVKKFPVSPDLEWADYNPVGHYLTGHLYLLWWGTGVNSMKLSVGQSIRTNFTRPPDKTAYLGEMIETEEGLHILKGMAQPEVSSHETSLTRRLLLDECGEGILYALAGADREIVAYALDMLRRSLDVLAHCDGVVGPDAHDTILHADSLLSDAQFEIEAQGTIPPVRSINNGLSEAASCLLGLAIRSQPENVRSIEIGTGPTPVKVRRVSR